MVFKGRIERYLSFDVDFIDLKIQRTDENDWILYKIEKGNFQGYGGPLIWVN